MPRSAAREGPPDFGVGPRLQTPYGGAAPVLYVLPVSGPYFPLQLTALCLFQHLTRAAPELVLASSGGGVVAALGFGAGWQAPEIRRRAGRLSAAQLYAKAGPLVPDLITWGLVGNLRYPTPRIYAVGEEAFGGRLGPGAPPQGTELVLGTYCVQERNARLFSSAPAPSTWTAGTQGVTHLQDAPSMTRAVLASAAVPFVLPPVRVEPRRPRTYVDGGVYAPSPLSSMWPRFAGAWPLRAVYFVSTAETPPPFLGALAPVVEIMDAAAAREAADAADAFRQNAARDGLPTATLRTADPREAAARWMEAPSALLTVIPRPKHTYAFDLFGFSGDALLGVLDRYRDFEYVLLYVPPTAGPG